MEELVAELGSAFLSADLELTPEVREDHAAYIGSWIKVLKNDKRAIFTAASHAQRRGGFPPRPAETCILSGERRVKAFERRSYITLAGAHFNHWREPPQNRRLGTRR